MTALIKFEQDMAQAILGVNKIFNKLLLSNYSLTTQIVIINLTTAFLALIFIIFFNIYLLSNNKNIKTHYDLINLKLNEITSFLSKNAVKRIMTFDDSCNRTSIGTNRESSRLDCEEDNLETQKYQNQSPQLDPTYTQEYIYSNFLKTSFNVKVFDENWIKFADTEDFYYAQDEVIILEIDDEINKRKLKKLNFYQIYKKHYFIFFNYLKQYFDKKKLKKLKNDNIAIMETIKTKKSVSYIYRDQNQRFMSRSTSPILKNNKVYGVVLIITPLAVIDREGSSQSILLTNFFLFFISIMFVFSILFSKSIVNPIKLLSKITQLERDKAYNKIENKTYPKRNDEIGILSNDIKNMSQKLKKRIREIEQFAEDVSHELKNPLAGLKSSADLLLSKNIDKNNRELLIKNISEDTDKMNSLISDISNYTLTQVEISREAVEKIELIKFFKDFKSTIHNKNFEIIVKNNDDEIWAEINTNKFLQVLSNLIDNASTYAPLNSKLLIFLKRQDDSCIINFVDQGDGISLDYKDKIFDRFYTDRSLDRKSHSGLGLSISKRIVENINGDIYLIKSPHLGFDGACFEIKLPLKGF